MNNFQKTGLAFGLTSGVITTLGVIIGMSSATGAKLAIIAGILTVAIADSFSDALGIHISQETSKNNSHSEVWQATTTTFISKIIIGLTFLIPILLLPLTSAIITTLIWGLILITTFNYYLAKSKSEHPGKIIAEHLSIAVLVIAITYTIGKLISFYS